MIRYDMICMIDQDWFPVSVFVPFLLANLEEGGGEGGEEDDLQNIFSDWQGARQWDSCLESLAGLGWLGQAEISAIEIREI